MTNTGDVLSWGYGTQGQLGIPDKKSVPNPTLINFGSDKKFKKIYCGYAHSMTISNENEVYTFGDGSKGQLGKVNSDYSNPSTVDELMGKDIVKG